jgi:hypothetical protein
VEQSNLLLRWGRRRWRQWQRQPRQLWSLLVAVLSWSLLCCPTLAETEHFYLLEQIEVNNGNLATYISPTGAHIVSKNLGYEIICKAPEWKVVFFDNKDKKLAALPLEDWVKNCTADAFDEWTALKNPKTGTARNMLGHRCIVISSNADRIAASYPKPALNGVLYSSHQSTSSHQKMTAVVCLVLDDVRCDPRVVRFINSYMGLPNTKSVVLEAHEYFTHGVQHSVQTKSITEVRRKEAKIEYPDASKYKTVTSPLLVMVNNQKKGQYSDLLELGIGKQFGSEKK